MRINWFVVTAAIFIFIAIAVTLFPGEEPRGFVNTPIGIAIVSSVLGVAYEVVLVRKEIIKNRILGEDTKIKP